MESFAYRIGALWNELDLPKESYEGIKSFKTAVESCKLKGLEWIKRFVEEEHCSVLECNNLFQTHFLIRCTCNVTAPESS